MATVPDRQPFGIDVVGYAPASVGLRVTRAGVASVVGLGRETEPAGADEVQETAATDSNAHAAASRAPAIR